MANADINKRLETLGQMIAAPASLWKKLHKKPFSSKDVLRGFFYPAVVIFGIAEFAGMLLSAYVTGSFAYILLFSLMIMAGLLVAYFLSVWALNYLLKSYEVKAGSDIAYQLLALPLVLGYFPIAITALFRSMFFLIVLCIYAIYIFWLGTQQLPGLDKEKAPLFGILSIIFTVGIHLLTFLLIMTLREPLMSLL
ncbi:MAG: hypothetical protein ACLFM1_05845 [Bacteroidales bacterium]